MTQFPNPQHGDAWADQSAASWRTLVAEVRKLRNITVGPGLVRSDTGTGIQISLASDAGGRLKQQITVAVVATSVEGVPTVEVRRVCYADVPPGEARADCDDGAQPACTMAWYGEPFAAYPDYGRVASDYDAFVWDDDRPPMRGTTFLRAEYESGIWRVLVPAEGGGGVDVAVVRDVGVSGDDHFVLVQLVEPDPAIDPWDGSFRFVPNSTAQAVSCWGHFKSRHYYPYVFHGDTVTEGAIILPLIHMRGAWYALPVPRFKAQVVPLDTVRTSDCTFARSRVFGGG